MQLALQVDAGLPGAGVRAIDAPTTSAAQATSAQTTTLPWRIIDGPARSAQLDRAVAMWCESSFASFGAGFRHVQQSIQRCDQSQPPQKGLARAGLLPGMAADLVAVDVHVDHDSYRLRGHGASIERVA